MGWAGARDDVYRPDLEMHCLRRGHWMVEGYHVERVQRSRWEVTSRFLGHPVATHGIESTLTDACSLVWELLCTRRDGESERLASICSRMMAALPRHLHARHGALGASIGTVEALRTAEPMPRTCALDVVKMRTCPLLRSAHSSQSSDKWAAETDYSSALISSFMYAWVCWPQ